MTSRRVLRAAAVRDSWSWEGSFFWLEVPETPPGVCRAGLAGVSW